VISPTSVPCDFQGLGSGVISPASVPCDLVLFPSPICPFSPVTNLRLPLSTCDSRRTLQRLAACVSARVFWNVVRLGGVGPNKSFETALREMLPGANWDVLLSRNQAEKEEGFYRVTAGGRAGSRRGGEGGAKRQQGSSAGGRDAEGEAQVEASGEGDEEIDLREEEGVLQEDKDEKEAEDEAEAEGDQ
jgi:hypothetical protein